MKVRKKNSRRAKKGYKSPDIKEVRLDDISSDIAFAAPPTSPPGGGPMISAPGVCPRCPSSPYGPG